MGSSPERDVEPGERAAKRLKFDESLSRSNGTGDHESAATTDGNTKVTAFQPDTAINDKPLTEDGNHQTTKDSPPKSEDNKPADPKPTETQEAPEQPLVEKKVDARDARDRGGMAPVKAEYLIDRSVLDKNQETIVDDDAAEGRPQAEEQQERGDDRDKKRKKGRGQNQQRNFGQVEDAIRICNSRAFYDEFSPRECRFGDRCKLTHDLRKYLADGRREDVAAAAFDGKCPVFDAHGVCPSGWKCRFVKSHMKEVEHEDGRKELILLGVKKTPSGDDGGDADAGSAVQGNEDERPGVVNVVDAKTKIDLNRRRVDLAEADKYITWLNKEAKFSEEINHRRKTQVVNDDKEDLRAQYTEPPLKPSEKRKLYFGRETPVLAPLTTQGNLPFRRLCVELGAQLTYSEMAMGLPLLQGTKADWTLMKAHEIETAPPRFAPTGPTIVEDYDNARDLRFGAQISANQAWVAVKATETLRRYVPHLRVVDLNCGCPIDMVYKSGAGSALLEAHGKLERIVRGMNAVSGEIPVSVKIRTGVKGNRPTAPAVIGKLAFGSREHRERLGAPGCAAITLHGRSREQRYSRRADWGYIAECATLVKSYNVQRDKLSDTVAEPDESTLANTNGKGTSGGGAGKMFFLGNGDCYSHEDYSEHIDKAGVDAVMVGRGALVKPWLFEEIEKGQYLDKSASERLGYVERFVRYGLDAWGSDEVGIGFTRRFLLEWLSFTHRYVPVGLLERLPPSLNDRPPAFRGRNELETLLASNNYKDWIKISEMFLGPCHPGFTFQPKHKSNSYEAEG